MTIIDRRYSVAEGTAVKAPCRVATTANITLSGLQTIDGVTVVEHDRVLVKSQTTGTENGIYEASSGNWLRTKDFDGSYDVVTGTRVFITSGTVNAMFEFAVSTTGTIVVDTTSIAFVLSASLVAPGGSNTQVQYNNNGLYGGITGATTDGIKMTLVAPILGTPTSVTLTNATGLPISTGVSGLGTGVATALATAVGSAGGPVVNGGSLGSPSSVTNMPAFTLTGTISAGGNQINNVIIGNSTPLAGSFTTVSGSTSMTTPLRYGGSAAGSTALLNGTSSGSPSSAYVNIQSNGQFTSIGNTTPKTYLDINRNLSSSPALASSVSMVRMQGPDGTGSGFELVNYGNGAATANVLGGVAAGGTAASPSTTLNGQHMFNMSGYGYNAGFVKGGIWLIYASENWTASAQGTRQDWYVTPNGTTTLTQAMSLHSSGGLTVGGLLADYGAGNINAGGGLATAAPTTKTANYVMTVADSSLIFNGAGSLTLTLLSAVTYPGRWLLIKTIAAQTVVSATSNVVPQAGGAAGTAILAATAGKWAWLQSDGTSWQIMASN